MLTAGQNAPVAESTSQTSGGPASEPRSVMPAIRDLLPGGAAPVHTSRMIACWSNGVVEASRTFLRVRHQFPSINASICDACHGPLTKLVTKLVSAVL